MSNEQNIADILKLLRESVDNPTSELKDTESSDSIDTDVSADRLHETLKQRFSADSVNSDSDDASPYQLDSDFFDEFIEETDAAPSENENGDGVDDAVEAEAPAIKDPIAEEPEEQYVLDGMDIEELDGLDAEDSGEDAELDTYEELAASLTDEELELIALKDDGAESDVLTVDSADEVADASEVAAESIFAPVAVMDDFDDETEVFAEDSYEDFDPVEVDESAIADEEDEKVLNEALLTEYEEEDVDLSDEEIDAFFSEDTEDSDIIDEQTELLELEEHAEEADGEDVTEEAPTEEAQAKEEPERFVPEEAPKNKPVSFKALIMDYGRPDPEPSVVENEAEVSAEDEEDTPDISAILSDFSDFSKAEKEDENAAAKEFLARIGCEEEIEDIPPEMLSEVLSDYGDAPKERTDSNTENKIKTRREEYRKNILWTSVRFVLGVIMTFIIFLYDLLPA